MGVTRILGRCAGWHVRTRRIRGESRKRVSAGVRRAWRLTRISHGGMAGRVAWSASALGV
nr:MAG TPA: hypothetical protein [Caudoviricetes sp.]